MAAPHNARELSRRDVERAIHNSLSNNQAAKYVGVSKQTWKRYASRFIDEESGKTLYELHNNKSGIGVKKMTLSNCHGGSSVMDILEGKVTPLIFSFKIIKSRIIEEGLLEERCAKCGFKEHRILDYKVPIILSFKDGNKKNIKLHNMEFLCYNCYFLTIGDLFEKKQIEAMEDYTAPRSKSIDIFDLPKNTGDEIKKGLNLENKYLDKAPDDWDPRADDFGDDLILSRRNKWT